ncbi:MAG: hypothetical protein WBB36_05020, partial [Chitinophagales bacterium]
YTICMFISCFIFFINNASGQCNSLVSLTSQFDVDHFAGTGCTNLKGGLYINGSGITNLDSLYKITHVKNLYISGTFLSDLSGLKSLDSIDGTLGISENGLLLNLNGLQKLSAVGSLYIWQNPQIADITQLSKITHTTAVDTSSDIDGRIWIGYNQLLSDLDGLQNITRIDGELNIESNPSLENLFGFSGLQTVRKYLAIQKNNTLY